MKILILGAGGLLGSRLAEILADQEIIVGDRPEWDITSPDIIEGKIQKCFPDWVINCAAITDVTAAEKQKALVYKVNASGPLFLAKICNQLAIPLIQLSTDYVFDGQKNGEYNEDDPTNPLNVYGQSKVLGEQQVMANCQKYFIIRTSWLFGKTIKSRQAVKKNFVDKMLELGQAQKEIKVVDNQFSKPTSTNDLAKLIRSLIESPPAYGIYHGVNEQTASWFQFAEEIFKQAQMKIKLIPISASEFFSNNIRPKNSALKNNKLPLLRPWPEALADYLQSRPCSPRRAPHSGAWAERGGLAETNQLIN